MAFIQALVHEYGRIFFCFTTILIISSFLPNTECPAEAYLPILPDTVNCHLTSNCTSITCCMEVTRLMSRPVTFHLSLDSCSWTISYGIDSFVIEPTVMYNFEFDVWHEFWMKGIFRLKYVLSIDTMRFLYEIWHF